MIQFKRPCLDSSVYIAAINNEPGRVEIARDILNAADEGQIQIVASTFVAAEVIKMKGEGEPLSPESETKIDAILRSPRIQMFELDLSLAIEARRVARLHSLKPGDAIHLATAIRAKADVLLRFDNRFRTNGQIEGIEVCDPYWYGPQTLFDPPPAE